MIHPEKFLICILGGIIYAFGVNLFIVPFGLYSGGLVGIAQLVRTLLADYIHIDFGSRDISGIFFYALNVPILIYAFPRLDKLFFIKTFISVTALTVAMSFIPTVKVVDDCLASTMVGGFDRRGNWFGFKNVGLNRRYGCCRYFDNKARQCQRRQGEPCREPFNLCCLPFPV